MVEYKTWRRKDGNHKQGHGLRAVDRDLNTAKNDEEIAHMLGQESGGAAIKSVYGGVPRNWGTTLPRLSWLPTKRQPEWEMLPECAGITQKVLNQGVGSMLKLSLFHRSVADHARLNKCVPIQLFCGERQR